MGHFSRSGSLRKPGSHSISSSDTLWDFMSLCNTWAGILVGLILYRCYMQSQLLWACECNETVVSANTDLLQYPLHTDLTIFVLFCDDSWAVQREYDIHVLVRVACSIIVGLLANGENFVPHLLMRLKAISNVEPRYQNKAFTALCLL